LFVSSSRYTLGSGSTGSIRTSKQRKRQRNCFSSTRAEF
jgi:hypothetical protein